MAARSKKRAASTKPVTCTSNRALKMGVRLRICRRFGGVKIDRGCPENQERNQNQQQPKSHAQDVSLRAPAPS